jgi:hypothetical protein
MSPNQKWQSLIDEQIQEVLGDGNAAELPGAGKPLNLNDGAYAPDEMRMAYKIMADNDVLPEWIMMGKELEQGERKLRDRLQAAVSSYRRALVQAERVPHDAAAYKENAQKTWQAALRTIEALVEQYNEQILNYNLKVPPAIPHRRPFDLEREVDQALRQ